ncbi:hypothetical protein A3F66_05945 [candidate division TM6 bacterium RIFCSPHIGHO2_12_FULL_32_22]|nr:MAG: hypothetical protein A3F66_05945 [candidate division TM6 bacterium RIFCSPHIGHO2_12_FULL_32_22]
MKRFIDHYLKEWKEQSGFRPLLLRGARQVGKTYAVRELGKQFDNIVELNLELNPELKAIFKHNLDPHRIIREISSVKFQQIVPGKTLLFFDEIQAEPQAVTALRYFYEMIPDLHVIAAGSLLDFAIEQVGIPVGRVEFLYMYPLSFLEFLYASGANLIIKEILKHDIKEPISEIIHSELLRYISEYLAIGGMPEVVNSWSKEKNPLKCFAIHQRLVDSYKYDFTKYAKKFQIKYLDILLPEIPRQMGKKFKYSAVEGDFRKRELSPCLDLLVTAGVINKVYHTAAQGLPLGAQVHPDDFKIIFLDVALAQSLLGLNLGEWLIDPDQQFVNKGEIVEAFIGQEILAYSNPIQKKQLYYWLRAERTSQAEVDYITNIKQDIIPIEVKSGAGSTLKSMRIFLETHELSKTGIRFSTQNYSAYENIFSYPLYAVCSALKSEIAENLLKS